jgi:hypothetical protein
MSIGDTETMMRLTFNFEIYSLCVNAQQRQKKIQKSNKLRNKLNGRDIDGDV